MVAQIRKDCPWREKAVSYWETETLILRLIAVLFVFALLRVCRRGKETGRETVLYLIVVAASAIVNLLRTGGGGFLMTVIGAMAAFAVSAPLLASDRVAVRDVAAPVAAGSLLGPLGGLAAIAIAAAIHIVQRSPGIHPAVMDRIAPRFADHAAWPKASCRSVLAVLENRRLGGTPRDHQDGSSAGAGGHDGAAVNAVIDMMSWRTSLAMATMAVLMTDMFI